MIVTLEQLEEMANPKSRKLSRLQPDLRPFVKAINKWTEKYCIQDDEFCLWIAQCVWECGFFVYLTEPKSKEWLIEHYWKNEDTRADLGNLEELHAWLFCGRGLIHLTGFLNLLYFSYWLSKEGIAHDDIIISPSDIAENIDMAVLAGIFYWKTRVDEKGSFADITKDINGGYSNLTERKGLCARAKRIFL